MSSPGEDRAIGRIRAGVTWESWDSLFQRRGGHCIFLSTHSPTDKKFSSLMAVKSTRKVLVFGSGKGGRLVLPTGNSFRNTS